MNDPSRRVFVTGGSGLIGRHLLRASKANGWRITALTRNADRARAGEQVESGASSIEWVEGDATASGGWTERLHNVDAVIALAGEPIFEDRWSDEVKQRLRKSRVSAIERLVDTLRTLPESARPQVLLTASSYGWYAPEGDDPQDEFNGVQGTDFLGLLSADWEDAAMRAASFGVRVVNLRFGLVLAADGGLLEGLIPRFRAILGGSMGPGDQYLPMVHIEDAIRLILFAMGKREIEGPLNVSMPEPPTMREFAKSLGSALNRPVWLTLPTPLVRLKLGEASEAVLRSRRIVPEKALQHGFEFEFPMIGQALSELLAD